jgi:hypothetical protein
MINLRFTRLLLAILLALVVGAIGSCRKKRQPESVMHTVLDSVHKMDRVRLWHRYYYSTLPNADTAYYMEDTTLPLVVINDKEISLNGYLLNLESIDSARQLILFRNSAVPVFCRL